MSNWNVYTYSSGSEWVFDDYIPRANADLDIGETSTQTEVMLADGSTAVLIPETTIKYQPINFTWLNDDGTVKAKIRDYIVNNDYLKIVTHVGDEEYFGYFVNVQIVWLVGQADKYDLIGTFRRVDGV